MLANLDVKMRFVTRYDRAIKKERLHTKILQEFSDIKCVDRRFALKNICLMLSLFETKKAGITFLCVLLQLSCNLSIYHSASEEQYY